MLTTKTIRLYEFEHKGEKQILAVENEEDTKDFYHNLMSQHEKEPEKYIKFFRKLTDEETKRSYTIYNGSTKEIETLSFLDMAKSAPTLPYAIPVPRY